MKFNKTIETIKINISLKEMWIEQKIGENVAELMRRDFAYDVKSYFDQCVEVMMEAGLHKRYAKDLAFKSVSYGYELDLLRKTTGQFADHNASGAHPRVIIGTQCDELHSLHQLLMTAAYVAVAAE